MSKLPQTLEKLMTERGMKPAQLARAADVDSGLLSRILKGEALQIPETIMKLADALNVHPADLWGGRLSNVAPAELGNRNIPVLSYENAVIFIAGGSLDEAAVKDSVRTNGEYSNMAFALKIRGESMFPALKEGWTVIVDPSKELFPGAYIFASSAEEGLVIREYRKGGINEKGEKYFELHAANPIFGMMRSDRDSIQILGVVAEHIVKYGSRG
jgi:SOS-response transcriptional repressor LexA